MQPQKHPSNHPRQQADPSETVSLPPYLDVSPFGPLSGSGNHRGMFFLTFCQQLSVWQTAAGAPPFFPPEARFLTERQKSHRPDYSIIGPVRFLFASGAVRSRQICAGPKGADPQRRSQLCQALVRAERGYCARMSSSRYSAARRFTAAQVGPVRRKSRSLWMRPISRRIRGCSSSCPAVRRQ